MAIFMVLEDKLGSCGCTLEIGLARINDESLAYGLSTQQHPKSHRTAIGEGEFYGPLILTERDRRLNYRTHLSMPARISDSPFF